MVKRLLDIIKELQFAIKSSNITIADEVLFREAMISFRQEKSNPKGNNSEAQSNNPTEKQLNLIEKHRKDIIAKGFNIDNITTREEATKLIQEYLRIKELLKVKPTNNVQDNGLYDEESSYL